MERIARREQNKNSRSRETARLFLCSEAARPKTALRAILIKN
jgi:hypothetical protein